MCDVIVVMVVVIVVAVGGMIAGMLEGLVVRSGFGHAFVRRGAALGRRMIAATTPTASRATLFFFLFVLSILLFEERLTIGDGDLIIIRMDFRKGEEAVTVTAVFHECGLKRRFDPCDFGEIDVSAELLLGSGLEIEFLDAVTAEHHHPSFLGM
jgi:hypothetical protein